MAEEFTYQKERKYFGRVPQGFDDTEIKIIGSHPIVPEKKEEFCLRNPNKLVLDNIPVMSEHKVSNVLLNSNLRSTRNVFPLARRACVTLLEAGPMGSTQPSRPTWLSTTRR
jgi:hypothetical protein